MTAQERARFLNLKGQMLLPAFLSHYHLFS